MKSFLAACTMVGIGAALSLNGTQQPHSQIITFFVHPYPSVKAKRRNSIDIQPARLNKRIAKKNFGPPKNPHIYAAYGGYMAYSGTDNQITFPRKTQKEELDILVTPQVMPIFLTGTNIDHWVIPENMPRDYYRVTRRQDPKTKLYFWDSKKLSPIKSNTVPLHTIIIFAKPKNVVIPDGITLTPDTAQFVLPPVYVKPSYDPVANAVFTRFINMFYSQPKD